MKEIKEKYKCRKNTLEYFFKSLFLPTKVSNTLALQQNTITISSWIILALGISAIIIEALHSDNHWLSFAGNVFVGIVCSAVIVAVTAYLQFRLEQEKRIKEHNTAVYQFLSCVKDCLFKTDISYQREQFLIESLYNECDQYFDKGLGICWYSYRKAQKYFDVVLHVLKLTSPLLKEKSIVTLEDYRKEISHQEYDKAVNSAITFYSDYMPHNNHNKFESLKREL